MTVSEILNSTSAQLGYRPSAIHVGSRWKIEDRRQIKNTYFYRAMHFSAKRGIAIACRLSVRNVGGL